MDMVLNICISDGTEIIIDGFDEISFYKELPKEDVSHSGYSWQKEYYNDLMNYLCEFEFIGISRKNPSDTLEYRGHSFAFQNQYFSKNEKLIIRTNCITTIIDMYN